MPRQAQPESVPEAFCSRDIPGENQPSPERRALIERPEYLSKYLLPFSKDKKSLIINCLCLAFPLPLGIPGLNDNWDME